METQELKTAFLALQDRVERVAAREVELRRDTAASKLGTLRRKLRRQPIWDLFGAALVLMFVGAFASSNVSALESSPMAAIPAALLFAIALATIYVAVRHLVLTESLDPAQPIVAAQSKLGQLRALRLRTTRRVFLAALPLWVCIPIMLGQSVFGPKFIIALNPVWIAANFGLGIAVLPMVRKLLDRPWASAALVGSEIAQAQAQLDEIQEFQGD